jgi:peptidoglycan-associated lipoprotein
MRLIRLFALASFLLLLGACSHAQPSPIPASAAIVAEATPPPEVLAPAPEPVATPPAPEVAPVSLYFEYDSADLSQAARTALQVFFDQAREQPDVAIRIEGNCDERGTSEYNIALGQRRADAAKRYLQDLGMDPASIATISYGNERPRATGDDEAAWQENRRDDLVSTSQSVNVSSAAEMAFH